MADDDPELSELRALNACIEALQLSRGDGPDDALDAAIDRLEHKAAAIIEARCERRLAPVRARFDAAMAEARRLLGDEP